MSNKILKLPLKKVWFDMTKQGIKTEDYREICIYWFRCFCKNYKSLKLTINSGYGFINDSDVLDFVTNHRTKNRFLFKDFKHNAMTLGYPKSSDTDRIVTLEHKGIEIRTGNPEWGAEPNKLYFVIKHGEIL